MSNNQSLVDNLVRRGRPIRVLKNPVSRYNYVVLCHNTPYNQVDGFPMDLLPRSRIYEVCFPLLRLKYCILMILLGLCPVINLLTWLLLVFLWLHYERAASVVRKNSRLVPDPLVRMVYIPELCGHFGVINKFLAVRLEFLAQLNIEIDSSSRTREGLVHFMIYNDAFKEHYTTFFRYRWLHLIQLLHLTVVALVSYYFCLEALT